MSGMNSNLQSLENPVPKAPSTVLGNHIQQARPRNSLSTGGLSSAPNLNIENQMYDQRQYTYSDQRHVHMHAAEPDPELARRVDTIASVVQQHHIDRERAAQQVSDMANISQQAFSQREAEARELAARQAQLEHHAQQYINNCLQTIDNRVQTLATVVESNRLGVSQVGSQHREDCRALAERFDEEIQRITPQIQPTPSQELVSFPTPAEQQRLREEKDEQIVKSIRSWADGDTKFEKPVSSFPNIQDFSIFEDWKKAIALWEAENRTKIVCF